MTIVGSLEIVGGIIFNRDRLTLTCITTGGPATTVTWTRDSTIVTGGTETVLNNSVTSQYNHTLMNVATAGDYTFKVSNRKPSVTSASIRIGMLAKEDALLTERCIAIQ